MRKTLVTATALAVALLAGATGHAAAPVIDVGPLVEPSILPVAATGHAHVAPDVIVIRYTYNGITDISPPTRLDVFYDVAPGRLYVEDCANRGGTYSATFNTCQGVDY